MEFIEIIKVLVMGIIEGLTEWLPISSTGHMILAREFIKLDLREEFVPVFLVVIQLGAIMAVVVLFFRKLWPFTADKSKRYIKKDTWTLWFHILVSCLPAGIIGVVFGDQIDAVLENYVVVAVTLIAYGILFIVIERSRFVKNPGINSISQISYKTALLIGIFQVLALIPGTSRSGATIIGAMLIGTSRVVAAEYTFYLAVPVMFGASFIKLVKFGFDFTGQELAVLLLGMLSAFIVSVLAIRFLMNYIKKHSFAVFGWYRIALGAIVLAYFISAVR